MREFLFDTPYWLLGGLVVLGIALWVSGNARQEKRLQLAGYLAFLIAATLALLSYFVDTDRELVTKRTRQIVEAVEKKDTATAQKLLHPRATLGDMNKQQIADRIGTAADQLGIQSVRITSLEVTPQPLGNEMTATLAATANASTAVFSGPVPSTWDLTWVKTNDGWLLRDIIPRSMPTMEPGALIDRLKGLKPAGK
jgi:hypothetical protein